MSFPVVSGPIKASLDANQKADLAEWLERLELNNQKVVISDLWGRLNKKYCNRRPSRKEVEKFVEDWQEERRNQPVEAS